MQTRIYVVSQGENRRLVEAASQAQAIRHCVKNVYQAKVASAREVAQLARDGMQVELAGEESLADDTAAQMADG